MSKFFDIKEKIDRKPDIGKQACKMIQNKLGIEKVDTSKVFQSGYTMYYDGQLIGSIKHLLKPYGQVLRHKRKN